MEFSTNHINYLSRVYLDESDGKIDSSLVPEDVFIPQQSSLTVLHLTEVSRFWDLFENKYQEPYLMRYRMGDVLIGCYGAKIALFFLVCGFSSSIQVYMGTLEHYLRPAIDYKIGSAIQALKQSLPGHYPGIQLEEFKNESLISIINKIKEAKYYGLITGLPSLKREEEIDDPAQIDLLIRTMYGTDWGLLVLAQPVPDRNTNSFLNSTINEMRLIENAEQTKMRRAPLAEAYFKKLEILMEEFNKGRAIGLWSTTAYYFSSKEEPFFRLGAALRAYYSGKESQPEPIRTIEFPALANIVPSFGQPIMKPEPGPGKFEYPFRYQTLLNSERLANFMHLPRLEMPGFTIKKSCRFDVAPHQEPQKSTIKLGDILDRGRQVGHDYLISTSLLNKHVLVVGVTGSGKTNTCFHILKQLWKLGIPSLVIEPAKTEYRVLLEDSLIGPDLRVFTLGNELVSPFRLNPFEFEKGAFLSSHIDLLKSVFNAAFSMWTVLPQILEQSLHNVYREYGWDVVRNENCRINNSSLYRTEAFPTLADLQQTVSKLVDRLGYEPKTTSEIKAALITRIQSLRIGGKGRMLDTRESFSIGKLLEKPTIFELEEIGDDDEKAFLMGLLLVKLYEYLRICGLSTGNMLKHVVVVEEAHRLLSNVPMHSAAEEANTRGKAVETFVNMLSEVRAYGEGFLVAEQIPSKLAPDVIKNTNVKIVHRTVSGEDRNLMSQTMNMKDRHSDQLGTLTVGEAVVFAEGDDLPIMVRAPKYEKVSRESQAKPINTIELLKKHLPVHFPEITLDCVADCKKYTGAAPLCYNQIQKIVETEEFQDVISYYVLSIVEMPQSIIDILPTVLEKARPHYSGLIETESLTQSMLVHSIDFYLRRIGQHYLWPFAGIIKLKDELIPNVLEALQIVKLNEDQSKLAFDENRLAKFRELYRELCTRDFDPFPACKDICDQKPTPLCLYRYRIRRLLYNRRLHSDFLSAIDTSKNPEDMLEKLRDVSFSACSLCLVNNAPKEEQIRIALCFAIHKLDNISNIRPELQIKLVNQFFQYLQNK